MGYPRSQRVFMRRVASASPSGVLAAARMDWTTSGWGWSTTLNTLSAVIAPIPAWVACSALIAPRMSPCAENSNAPIPSSSQFVTPSACMISRRRARTCSSPNRVYRKIAHRLCNGSIILLDVLHANANRVVPDHFCAHNPPSSTTQRNGLVANNTQHGKKDGGGGVLRRCVGGLVGRGA